MSILSLSRFTVGNHPRVRPGLDALAAFLCVEGYHSHAIGVVIDHVAREGTLAGLVDAGHLEPADEAAAEAAYVDALPSLGQTAPEWADESVYTDAESIQDAWERSRRLTLRSADGSVKPDVDEILLAAMNDLPY